MKYSKEKYPLKMESYQIIGICIMLINLCPNIKKKSVNLWLINMKYSKEKYPLKMESYQIIGICIMLINLCPNIKKKSVNLWLINMKNIL